MRSKIYADGRLIYDSMLASDPRYTVLSASIRDVLNKGGMCTLILPPGHSCYDKIPAMRTCVEIYRDDQLRWRGRALPHEDDLIGRRTIPCEGEMCFFNDSVQRPKTITGTPAQLLTTVLYYHNRSVDAWKSFQLGNVTIPSYSFEIPVTDPVPTYQVLQQLLSVCGGYLVIDGPSDARKLNWYAVLPSDSNQTIRLGQNLLDYSSTASVEGLATRIIPYGAADQNGKRLQISVLGKDYIDNPEAQKSRGIIEAVKIYEDITDPEVLRANAEHDLMMSGTIPEQIELSAADLSLVDSHLDAFRVGQLVQVESEPHGLHGKYALVALEEDLAQPGTGGVTLVRDALYYDGSPGLSGGITPSIRDSTDRTAQDAAIIATMQDAINAATDWLTNGLGYKVEHRDEQTGQVIETFYLDTPDMQKAKNVMRLGQSGIGFSHNGISGPYEYAFTIDGHFNASLITTGIINAYLIKAGILQDKKGKNYLNLETGEAKFDCQNLTINGVTAEEIAQQKADAAMNAAYDALNRYKAAVDGSIQDIRDQVDGMTISWFGQEIPTPNNYPANEWTTPEVRKSHVGDLYYITDNPKLGSKAYRWVPFLQGGYRWEELVDTESIKALELASQALDAADGKIRMFRYQPTPPYDEGDLWSRGPLGGMFICNVGRPEGTEYVSSDWGPADDKINEAAAKHIADAAASHAVDRATQKQIFDKLTDNGRVQGLCIKNGQLYVNASYIAAGILADAAGKNSINLVTGETHLDVDTLSIRGKTPQEVAQDATNDAVADILDEHVQAFINTARDTRRRYDPQPHIHVWFRRNLSTDPAAAWHTKEAVVAHEGDLQLYYRGDVPCVCQWTLNMDAASGRWVDLDKTELVAACTKVEKKDFASDGGVQIFFYYTPEGPYTVRDLWDDSTNGKILSCTQARTSGYNAADWELYNPGSMRWQIHSAAASEASTAVRAAMKNALTQKKVFDALTDNGQYQGFFMRNGEMYINASYIGAGILADPASNTVFNLSTGDLRMNKGAIHLGYNGAMYNFAVEESGSMTARSGKIAGFTMVGNNLETSDYKLTPEAFSIRQGNKDLGQLLVYRTIPPHSEAAGILLALGKDGKVLALRGRNESIMEYSVSGYGPYPGTAHFGVPITGFIDPNHGGGKGCYSGEIRFADGLTMVIKNGLIKAVY